MSFSETLKYQNAFEMGKQGAVYRYAPTRPCREEVQVTASRSHLVCNIGQHRGQRFVLQRLLHLLVWQAQQTQLLGHFHDSGRRVCVVEKVGGASTWPPSCAVSAASWLTAEAGGGGGGAVVHGLSRSGRSVMLLRHLAACTCFSCLYWVIKSQI